MKLILQIAIGLVAAWFLLQTTRYTLHYLIKTLAETLEKKALEKMTPEEKVIYKCRQVSEAIKKQGR